MAEAGEITALLRRVSAGDEQAESMLFEAVYARLKRTAGAIMKSERVDHTLQPTALVHEAFLRLPVKAISWKDRAHFHAVAANAMRRVLVDYARARGAQKRPDPNRRVDLADPFVFQESTPETLLALDEAITRLAAKDSRQAKVVELRVFAGMTHTEIGALLHLSERQVKREWQVAKLWLYSQLYDVQSDHNQERS